jgi:predicted nucleic acid-binding protein
VPQLIVADTGLISYLTKPEDRFALAYRRLLGRRTIALSFQTLAELLGADYTSARQASLDRAVARTVRLPHSDETSESYARVASVRRALRRGRRLGSDAGDADVWIISSALQYHLPLMSHDRQQVALARASGLTVETAHPQLKSHG